MTPSSVGGVFDVCREEAQLIQRLKQLAIGISELALMGCAAKQKGAPDEATPEAEEPASMEGAPTLVNQIGAGLCVYDHDGRYCVIGSKEMAAKFSGGRSPHTPTIIGGGPQGRTVALEVDDKKPKYVERLKARFQSNSV